ncbi:Hypothetical protein A7982_10143 [Minicystis rosea]|nr:Hypothetical protein A7982_10143 [Minicystis rosea]
MLLALTLSACGAKVAVDGAGGSGGAGECGVNGLPVPRMYRSCAADYECTISFIHLDCCGTPAAVGLTASTSELFLRHEHACHSVEAWCDCDPGPAQTDDGDSTDDAAGLHVTCDEGQCTTHAS